MVLWLLLPSSVAGGNPAQSDSQTRSPHGNLNIACQNCHTVYGWKPIRAVPEFDHNQTKFPLRGLHEGVTCTNCHTKMVFSNVGSKCADCHADIHRGKMAAACENCHTVRGWKVSVTQINMHMNRFPLTGAHAAAACEDCHKSGALSQFNLMSTECISCHQQDFNGATNPKHTTAAAFTTTPCQNCHSTDSWANAKFDHSLTGFLLTGMHAVPPRQCADCHVNNNYNLGAMTCIQCHQTDYNNTTNPAHAQMPQAFPAASCQNCHTTNGWTPANFDHSVTAFPLTGLHTVPPRQCSDCHGTNNYSITVTTCVSCHLKDFNSTTNPNHAQQGISTTCEMCHNTSGWSPATFDHAASGFPLTGQHTVPPRQCTDCHVNNNYNITATTCVSCHQTDYNNALSPVNHVAANFPTTCQNCHDTNSWTTGVFNHASTGFSLTGQHTVPPRQCTDCHTAAVGYNITATTCVSCHQNDYNTALSPVNHIAANFPTTCQNCHDTVLWTDAVFNHTSTGFALTGQHTVPPRQCTDCHTAALGYNITATTCVSCHQTDYNTALTPVNHPQANFPLTCETCHDTIAWTDGKFDHTATGFALVGMHAVPPRACGDCHNATFGGYNIASAACVNCHQTDFNNTNAPPHAASGFPTTCETCHDTIAWTDATFNHNNTAFPLQGAHTTTACALCHVNNNYTTLPTDCYGCHAADYNTTTSPAHSAAGFPTTCLTCHTTWVTTNWLGATFNHTWFNMNHGNANGICATCHTNPNDYSIFQCTGCHGNNNAANFHHPNVSGFVYNSVNCYQCHKNGGG